MFTSNTLMLAQAAPEPGGVEAPVDIPSSPIANGQAIEGADGAPIVPAPEVQQQPGMSSFYFMLLILALFMFVLIIPQRREKKRRNAMLEALKKGDRVQTVGGIIGTIVEIRPTELVLKVDENTNTRMRFSRSAIQAVLDREEAKAD